MEEIWKPIKDYEGYYEVSNLGNVRSVDRYVNTKNNKVALKKGKILKQNTSKRGYKILHLSKYSKTKNFQVHRLVAENFIPNINNLPCVNHIDENTKNNNMENLEWCSYLYNNNYGNRKRKAREKNLNGKCSKSVFQFSLNGEFIKKFPSLAQVHRELGYNQQNIQRCAVGKRKTAYGYIWKYDAGREDLIDEK